MRKCAFKKKKLPITGLPDLQIAKKYEVPMQCIIVYIIFTIEVI